MTFFKKIILAITLIFTSVVAIADNTNQAGAEITTVRYNAEASTAYFQTNGTWDAGECNPTYVVVRSTLAGKKELLSVALAAKMANKKVWFYGVCEESNNYFRAHYIAVL